MTSSRRAWIVAASIGAVEALKDQGICRWNYTAKAVVQHAKNYVRSASQAKNLSSQSSAAISKGLRQSKQSEESLRTVIAWVVAASIGAVEALKDQGICRWNYTVRSVVQHAKNHVRSASQAKNLSSQSSAAISKGLNKSKQSEESLRTVMYLSCWGPN
ncbi:hypothetical protein Godav_014281 [Gossypium davidsonii]|uniref:Wound-responsive family protein n=1 Tax=Gossypium davidsonii TaxID=34287 RepID=A0A7J8RKR7_GOSDV|nr:hypothetical protein [Gossypium davidsonii]